MSATARPHDWAQVRQDILTLFAANGGAHYGEGVTQLEHASQAAALAIAAGAAPELVLAALLHDVGHLLDAQAGAAQRAGVDRHHEVIGGKWLARHLGEAVAAPVRLHVDAKRYLCAVEPGYRAGLSDASEKSLVAQGGPFTDAEATAFADRPGAEAAIRLRRWDDLAKVPGSVPVALDDVLDRVAASLGAASLNRTD